MITKNDWINMLISEHFLTNNSLSLEEYNVIVEVVKDKIRFKGVLK